MTDKRSESYKAGIAPNRQKDSNSYSTDLHRHYELLCAGKGVPLSRGMYKTEGLSFLPGEPRNIKEMNDFPWQFGPGSPFDYVSQYVAVEQMPISEYGKSAEVELEWQYVLRQQQAPKCDQLPYGKSRESYEAVLNDTFDKVETEDGTTRVETESSTISSFLAGTTTENSFDTGTSRSSRISGSLSAELDSVKSFPKEGTEWRTADRKELAALVSQKSHGYLENCDLPPSQSSFSWRGHIICSDSNPSKNVKTGNFPIRDQKLEDSLLSKNDQNQPEGFKTGMPDPTPFAEHLPNVSEPLTIPSSPIPTRKHRSPKQGYETLGEALCHSQTRARQGEKLAAKAIQERDEVTQLLFREACAARTYKQWVETLELENRLLKMRYHCPSDGCFKNHSCSQCYFGTCSNRQSSMYDVSDKKKDSPWKNGRKRKKGNQRQWQGKGSRGWVSENNALVRCTIGLAFALGLSFAGAGLVIGWSMGWILLAN